MFKPITEARMQMMLKTRILKLDDILGELMYLLTTTEAVENDSLARLVEHDPEVRKAVEMLAVSCTVTARAMNLARGCDIVH